MVIAEFRALCPYSREKMAHKMSLLIFVLRGRCARPKITQILHNAYTWEGWSDDVTGTQHHVQRRLNVRHQNIVKQ